MKPLLMILLVLSVQACSNTAQGIKRDVSVGAEKTGDAVQRDGEAVGRALHKGGEAVEGALTKSGEVVGGVLKKGGEAVQKVVE